MMSFIKEVLSIGEAAVGLLSGSTTALKGVADLLRKPNPDLVELKSLAADAISKLLEAKTAQMELQEKLLELQNELNKRDRFQEQAGRYTLTRTDLGGMVYSLKPDQAGGEAAHDLCAACFEDQVKSVLQPVDFNTLGCPRCKARILKGDGRDSAMMVAPGRSTRDWSGY